MVCRSLSVYRRVSVPSLLSTFPITPHPSPFFKASAERSDRQTAIYKEQLTMNSERLSQAEREIGGLRAENNQLRKDESTLKADLRAAGAELTYVCVGGREEIER